MSIQTLLLAVVVVVYGAAQYILAAQAIRDLLRRPSVRGGNKTVWGIVILTLPIAGALLYNWMGPTSFLRRTTRAATSIPPRVAVSRRSVIAAPRKVTPITALRDERTDRTSTTPSPSRQPRPVAARSQATGSAAGRRTRPRTPDRLRRTGS
jgi:hypothetical protein